MFITVGIPTRRGDGRADVSCDSTAAEQIARVATSCAIIVTKSTVPIGAGQRIAQSMRQARPDLVSDVASSPESLREGSTTGDSMPPDCVLIGRDGKGAREVRRPLYLVEASILFTSLETAELTKYAANPFLAMKMTFINEMADLCERVGADVQDIARYRARWPPDRPQIPQRRARFWRPLIFEENAGADADRAKLGVPSRLVKAIVAVNDTPN